MKKYMACLMAALFIGLTLAACAGAPEPTQPAAAIQSPPVQSTQAQTPKLRIVATTFPQYDWTRQILGDQLENAELTLLMDDGVDLHSFQPTVEDIAKIAACDLFIYVGGVSDAWVAGALDSAGNQDLIAINLLETLGDGVRTEELVEGMEPDHDHEHEEDDHEHEEADEHEDEHEAEPDEHVWLSLRNAQVFTLRIAEALAALDAESADAYRASANAYNARLAALDEDYKAAVEAGKRRVLLFGDRFPFRYLTEDYGLTYYAAFSGCSAETEASFETVVFLSGKADELGLPCVMAIEGSDGAVAGTIVRSTKSADQAVLVLDSMQSVTAGDVAGGVTYLSVMEKNLSVLKQALA